MWNRTLQPQLSRHMAHASWRRLELLLANVKVVQAEIFRLGHVDCTTQGYPKVRVLFAFIQ